MWSERTTHQSADLITGSALQRHAGEMLVQDRLADLCIINRLPEVFDAFKIESSTPAVTVLTRAQCREQTRQEDAASALMPDVTERGNTDAHTADVTPESVVQDVVGGTSGGSSVTPVLPVVSARLSVTRSAPDRWLIARCAFTRGILIQTVTADTATLWTIASVWMGLCTKRPPAVPLLRPFKIQFRPMANLRQTLKCAPKGKAP